STIRLTGRACNHVIRDASPASVLSKILCSSKTCTATSSVFLLLSIPTKTSSRPFIVIPSLPAQSCHAQPFGLYNGRRPGPALRAAFAKPRISRSPAAAGGSQGAPGGSDCTRLSTGKDLAGAELYSGGSKFRASSLINFRPPARHREPRSGVAIHAQVQLGAPHGLLRWPRLLAMTIGKNGTGQGLPDQTPRDK